MPNTPDPANYLRSEIAAFDAGLRPNWEPWQRKHYLEVTVAQEGADTARGTWQPADRVEASVPKCQDCGPLTSWQRS